MKSVDGYGAQKLQNAKDNVVNMEQFIAGTITTAITTKTCVVQKQLLIVSHKMNVLKKNTAVLSMLMFIMYSVLSQTDVKMNVLVVTMDLLPVDVLVETTMPTLHAMIQTESNAVKITGALQLEHALLMKKLVVKPKDTHM